MILRTEEKVDRYSNGKIAYMETIGWIAPMFACLYPNRRESLDGKLWVRVGVNRKYWNNGKLQWEIIYDGNGNVVKV